MSAKDAKTKMQRTFDYFQKELMKVRGSRANPQLIEDIKVNVYESQMPVKQLATVSVVDPTLVTVQCWDKNNCEEIKKAIEQADVGVNPSIDGNVIRIPLPPLTEERREELVKVIKKLSEEAKVSIRRIRREFINKIKEGELSEDEVERGEKEIQKFVDEYNDLIGQEFEKKQEELLTI